MKAVLTGFGLGALFITVWVYRNSPNLARAIVNPRYMPPVFTNPRNER